MSWKVVNILAENWAVWLGGWESFHGEMTYGTDIVEVFFDFRGWREQLARLSLLLVVIDGLISNMQRATHKAQGYAGSSQHRASAQRILVREPCSRRK